MPLPLSDFGGRAVDALFGLRVRWPSPRPTSRLVGPDGVILSRPKGNKSDQAIPGYSPLPPTESDASGPGVFMTL